MTKDIGIQQACTVIDRVQGRQAAISATAGQLQYMPIDQLRIDNWPNADQDPGLARNLIFS